jgi:hypothetical protein
MNRMKCAGNTIVRRAYLVAVLGLLIAASVPEAVAGDSGAVSMEACTQLGQAAAGAAFGAVDLVGATAYYDPDRNVSVYAIEYVQRDDGGPVAVIASARRDDVPIIMMWHGLARHNDPDVMSLARRAIEDALGVAVSDPVAILWLDMYEVWAQFPELNPQAGEAILCNLYTGEIATARTLQEKWQNRRRNIAMEAEAPASDPVVSGIRIAGVGAEDEADGSRRRAEYIEGQWAAADDFLAGAAPRSSGISIQAPPRYTQYVSGVPNLNEQIAWDGQDWTGDSQIVAAMDVLLFWDTHGYDRLVDDGDLDAVHGGLREAMLWDRGSTDPNTASGLTQFINGSSYGNQYSFTIELLDMWASWPYRWPSFSDCRREIDSGRPALFGVRNYTDDPANSTDFAYGNQMMCAVGYYEGYPFGGSSSTEWVIVHDNWRGGDAANPYYIDDEPFIDWNRATDSLITVLPGPSGTAVTYPSAAGIVWRCGETQSITWNGFTGSDVRIELYKGSSLYRTIAASTANDGSHTWTIPGTQTPGSDFRVKITSTSNPWQYDSSDEYVTILDTPQVAYPTAPGIIWDRGSSYDITWTGFTGSYVTIELLKGLAYNRTIASSTGNTGVYRWTVPAGQTLGSDYRIRIVSTSDPAQYDYSDSDFTIADVPQVTYPTAPGVAWGRGIPYTITWDGFTGSYVTIELYKGQRQYSTIVSMASNTGSYAWTVPDRHELGTDFRIKITSTYDASQYDFSDEAFEIKDVATVTYPTAPGVTWKRGESRTITWAGFLGSYVRIDLYKGASLNRTIASVATNSGSYTWTVPSDQTLGSDFRIRIASTSSPSQYDDSDNYFSIIDPQVTYPTGPGVTWKVGESRTITWSGFAGSFVTIELYKGSSWNRTIASSTSNDGAYTWTPPADQTPGSDFRIRITSTSDVSQVDESDNYFTITNPRVTYPTEAGVMWKPGDSPTITWAGFTGSYVKIELYKGGSLDRTIASSASNTGSYRWTIPGGQTFGSDFRIRITSTSDPSQYDDSDNYFTIANPQVTYPTMAGITWRAGDSPTIIWTGFTGSYVKIELYKGATLSRTIASATANTGSYTWTVPTDQAGGSDFRVRVTAASDPAQYDDSDNYFTIANPRVTYPTDAGVIWGLGGTYTITWDGFIGSYVTIELYKGVLLHRTIAASTDNNGSYAWTVPGDQTLGTDFKIRVTLTSDRSQYDESDNYFTIDEVPCPPRPVALWRFESSGTFTRDSVGTNNLTNDGASLETTDFKEGVGCANLKANERDSLNIYDDWLSSNFPTRSGDTNVKMTVCFWMKPRSFPFDGTIISKYQIATDTRSWRMFFSTSGGNHVKLALGEGSGDDFTEYSFKQANELLVANHWYHVAFTYQASDRHYHVRIWDDTDRVVRVDREGTAARPMAVTNAPIVLGNTPLESTYFDGLLDEVAFFNEVLSSAQIDKVRRGECRLY